MTSGRVESPIELKKNTAGSGASGITATYGSKVTGNTGSSNGTPSGGVYIRGIHDFDGSTVTGNTAGDNGNNANDAYVWGIQTGGNCLVDRNTAYSNGQLAYFADNMNTNVSCEYGINLAP